MTTKNHTKSASRSSSKSHASQAKTHGRSAAKADGSSRGKSRGNSSSHVRRGASAATTTDHETIRRWVEQRGAHPATVKGTTNDTTGVLRIDFPGYSGQRTLKEVSWDDFFDKFDREQLAFLYQEKTAGGRESRFCKLISREDGHERKPHH
jgi:hypothetical protein